MKPTIGRIVIYRVTAEDAIAINLRRYDFESYHAKHAATPRAEGEEVSGGPGYTGHQGHVGNRVLAGDEFPALIIRAWEFGDRECNLQVFLDGNDTYWATSRPHGEDHGQWHWPPRVEHEPGDRPAAGIETTSAFRPDH